MYWGCVIAIWREVRQLEADMALEKANEEALLEAQRNAMRIVITTSACQ